MNLQSSFTYDNFGRRTLRTLHDLAISNKNIKNKQNQYYFSSQYFKKTFNKNDIIEYKITLAVNGYDYHLDIPVPFLIKLSKTTKYCYFFNNKYFFT